MMQPTLGENIRQARKTYGMNQTVLAERIGISKTSLSLIESGDTKDPRYSIVRRIARVLHLRIDDLDPLVLEEVPHA
jgi:transcriptional regulator with XRE-family HTH domain